MQQCVQCYRNLRRTDISKISLCLLGTEFLNCMRMILLGFSSVAQTLVNQVATKMDSGQVKQTAIKCMLTEDDVGVVTKHLLTDEVDCEQVEPTSISHVSPEEDEGSAVKELFTELGNGSVTACSSITKDVATERNNGSMITDLSTETVKGTTSAKDSISSAQTMTENMMTMKNDGPMINYPLAEVVELTAAGDGRPVEQTSLESMTTARDDGSVIKHPPCEVVNPTAIEEDGELEGDGESTAQCIKLVATDNFRLAKQCVITCDAATEGNCNEIRLATENDSEPALEKIKFKAIKGDYGSVVQTELMRTASKAISEHVTMEHIAPLGDSKCEATKLLMSEYNSESAIIVTETDRETTHDVISTDDGEHVAPKDLVSGKLAAQTIIDDSPSRELLSLTAIDNYYIESVMHIMVEGTESKEAENLAAQEVSIVDSLNEVDSTAHSYDLNAIEDSEADSTVFELATMLQLVSGNDYEPVLLGLEKSNLDGSEMVTILETTVNKYVDLPDAGLNNGLKENAKQSTSTVHLAELAKSSEQLPIASNTDLNEDGQPSTYATLSTARLNLGHELKRKQLKKGLKHRIAAARMARSKKQRLYFASNNSDDSDLSEHEQDSEYEPDSSDTEEDGDFSECSRESALIDIMDQHVGRADFNSVEKVKTDDNDISYIDLNMIEENVRVISDEGISGNMDADQSNSKDVDETEKMKPKRKWDKKACCPYCFELYAKLTRHLQTMHCDKPAVEAAMQLPLKSKARRQAFINIAAEGNFAYSSLNMKRGVKEIIPRKRGKDGEIEASKYISCSFCKGLFSKQSVWRHKQTCSKRDQPPDDNTSGLNRFALIMWPISEKCTEAFKETVLPRMRNDETGMAIMKDDLIIEFGCQLINTTGSSKEALYVIQKMRELARFFIVLNKNHPEITCLADAVKPQKFFDCVAAAQELCGYNEQKGEFGIPSLALKIGHLLKKIAVIVATNAAVSGNEEIEKAATRFSTLCEARWTKSISTMALRTLRRRRWNKPLLLPLAEDTCAMTNFLKETTAKALAALAKCPTRNDWNMLCQASLVQLTLFNRRRGGEAECMLVADYEKRTKGNTSTDVEKALSPFERHLCKNLSHVTIRGKRDKAVPVLFTSEMENNINFLIKYRSDCYVSEENPYVFARASRTLKEPYRTADCIRSIAAMIPSLKQSLALTTTRLRKHVAIMSQVIDLKDNELDLLASFMGHDVRVHRQFYRLPQTEQYIAKVGRLLLAMEKGVLNEFAGQTLENVNVDIGVLQCFL